jgi:hypothetical protein
MSLKAFAIVNGAIALSLFAVAVYVFFVSETTGNREEAGMVILAAHWFLGICGAFARRSRFWVTVASVPVITLCLLFAFILIFAPLGWGDENLPTARTLQIGALLLGAFQIWGLIAVFASKRTSHHP